MAAAMAAGDVGVCVCTTLRGRKSAGGVATAATVGDAVVAEAVTAIVGVTAVEAVEAIEAIVGIKVVGTDEAGKVGEEAVGILGAAKDAVPIVL